MVLMIGIKHPALFLTAIYSIPNGKGTPGYVLTMISPCDPRIEKMAHAHSVLTAYPRVCLIEKGRAGQVLAIEYG